MARSRSHLAGCSGHLHHSAAELLLLRSAGRELERSEEEDGMLPNVMEREKRLHASDKVCAGQRKHLKVGIKDICPLFTVMFLMKESRMKRHKLECVVLDFCKAIVFTYWIMLIARMMLKED